MAIATGYKKIYADQEKKPRPNYKGIFSFNTKATKVVTD